MIPQEAYKTHIEYGFPVQARSQDFLWGGGGGGAYLKNRNQIINVWIICHGTSEVTRGAVCRTYGLLTLKRAGGVR